MVPWYSLPMVVPWDGTYTCTYVDVDVDVYVHVYKYNIISKKT